MKLISKARKYGWTETRWIPIIRNLMTNALKYTCQGGNVTVQTQKNKSHWFITITDTGIGIPPMNKRKCSKAYSEGIMPSICKSQEAASACCLPTKLIKNHAGKISMSSIENVGTTFKTGIPYQKSEIQLPYIQKS